MSLWSIFTSLFRKPEATLFVMRAADMYVAHPQTDWSKNCSICGSQVGIYPSGQKVIAQYRTKIVCSRCDSPDINAQLAPGAVLEPFQSIPKTTSGKRSS